MSKIFINRTKIQDGKDGIVAYATISGDTFSITGIRIYRKGTERYVFFPGKKDKEGKDIPVVSIPDEKKREAFKNMILALCESGDPDKEVKLDDTLGEVKVTMWQKPTGANVGTAVAQVGSFKFNSFNIFKSEKIKESNEKNGRPELRDYMVANYRVSQKKQDGSSEVKDVFYFKGEKATELATAIVAAIPTQQKASAKATPKKEEPETADDDLPF